MSFEIKRNSVDKEYLKMTVLENVTVGLFTLDTFLDLVESKGSQIEDVMENLVEQINYLKGITSKTYIQQLPEVIQDNLVQARNFLVQSSHRYTYLSQGRQCKPELMLGSEQDVTWESTKELAEIGLAKYLFTISLLFNEVYNEPDILNSLTEDQQEKIKRFIEAKNEDAAIFEDEKYILADFSKMMNVNFDAEEECNLNPDEDETGIIGIDAFVDDEE